MQEFVMLIGLPGSGKTTYCIGKEDEYVILSSDTIREEILGDAMNQKDPQDIFKIMNKRTLKALGKGKSVIYDATNLKRCYRDKITKYIPKNVTKIAIVFSVPFEECLYRNNNRERVVPEYAMLRMKEQLELPQKEEGFELVMYRHY